MKPQIVVNDNVSANSNKIDFDPFVMNVTTPRVEVPEQISADQLWFKKVSVLI